MVARHRELMREGKEVCRYIISIDPDVLKVCEATYLTMDGRGTLRVYPATISIHVFVLHVGW